MSQLQHSELAELGRQAAQGSVSAGAELVNVRSGCNMSGEVAYFFDFRIKPVERAENAVLIRRALSHAVRDSLIHRGDETYPYVRVSTASSHSGASVD